MCGRATLITSPDELREIFGLDSLPDDLQPRFNIAPSQPLPVIRAPGRLELLPWGTKERRVINIRLERASTKPSSRCLVVVDGFYEWRGEKGHRRPIWFHRRAAQPDHWRALRHALRVACRPTSTWRPDLGVR